MTSKSLKECYLNYFGSGDPKANLWILGFEPGGNPFDQDQMEFKTKLEKCSEDEFVDYLNQPFSDIVEKSTYGLIFQILKRLERKNSYTEVSEKKRTIDFKEGSDSFFTNLFPLKFPVENSKKNAEITEYYKKVFADIDDYSNGNRINIFKKDWLLARHKNVFSKYIGVDKKIIFITKLNYDKYYLLLIFGDDCIEPSEIIPFKYGKGESAINIYSVNNRKLFFIPNSVSIVNKDIFASIIDKAKNFLENNYS